MIFCNIIEYFGLVVFDFFPNYLSILSGQGWQSTTCIFCNWPTSTSVSLMLLSCLLPVCLPIPLGQHSCGVRWLSCGCWHGTSWYIHEAVVIKGREVCCEHHKFVSAVYKTKRTLPLSSQHSE